jgi:hypothetical protein
LRIQIATHNDVVAAGKIDGWLALEILAVKQLAVFHSNVVCLVELNKIKPIIILQRIVC